MHGWRIVLLGTAVLMGTLSLGMAAEERTSKGEAPGKAEVRDLPVARSFGDIEPVVRFTGAMPTGVAVSHDGRIFVNFPRWGDKVEHTVAEVRSGETVAYPNEAMNRPDRSRPAASFVSVQSVVVDPKNRLWALDTGRIKWAPAVEGGPKLVGIDLSTNTVFKTITIPLEVALPSTYLNDVRFDLRRGKEGMAFITDSSGETPGIIVVDLASGRSWRRLSNHPSTRPQERFLPLVEGLPWMRRFPGSKPSFVLVGADGIAIGKDGKRLYYCPLSSWRLFSVSVDALADPNKTEEQVAQTVEALGDKSTAADGLESDANGNIYITSYDHNGIIRRTPEGSYEPLVHDPRILWPDTLCVATDGYLYIMVNQLHRQAVFHNGKDLREKPYVLFRTRIDAKPVLLK